MDVFDDEGIDPRKVQIAHTGDTDDLDYIEELLARGPWIGMDRYGLDSSCRRQAQRDRDRAVQARLREPDGLSQDACATMDWYPRSSAAARAGVGLHVPVAGSASRAVRRRRQRRTKSTRCSTRPRCAGSRATDRRRTEAPPERGLALHVGKRPPEKLSCRA